MMDTKPSVEDSGAEIGGCPQGERMWCCLQSGHRELYGVPRALQRAGVLDRLVTDVWVPPGSWMTKLVPGRMGRRLRDRYHPELPIAKVTDVGWRALLWEAKASIRGLKGSRRVLGRNAWWGSTAAATLSRLKLPRVGNAFAYCYEARLPFLAARKLGFTPVLGQIDPGPVEDAKVAEIVRRWPGYRNPFVPGGQDYYASWMEECRLAGRIVVNSEWSRAALLKAGVSAEKVVVLPLVYSAPAGSGQWSKKYPPAFSADRPLRVLFLGQCILRKGIAETIEAARSLADRPVEFTLVGNTDIAGLEGHFGRGRIKRHPRVSRAECHEFYRQADLFLFPTHSDGFGLTQLEAQAWKLPIVASRFCAEVVEDGRTGWVLPEVTSGSIVDTIEVALFSPALLGRMSEQIRPWRFGIDDLGSRLKELADVQPRRV
jgi:glycosyltransferase involved in cell wall biosynthesis